MKAWYLLYCKRNEQMRAEAHLENQGVNCYYPTISVNKIKNGKKREVVEPLFPSYVFIELDYRTDPSFTSIRSTRGVVDFVRLGRKPIEVNPELIHQLKNLTLNTETQQKVPKSGDTITIKRGQFSGIEAVFHESDGDSRSFMLIKLINTPTKVSVDNKDLELAFS